MLLLESMTSKNNDNKRPLVTIVIVNYHVANLVGKCVESIILTTHRVNLEIIIIDNSVCEEQKEQLTQIRDARCTNNIAILLVINKENVGFACANNQGLSTSNGEYIVLLNPDTIVADGWFEELQIVIDRNPEIGLISPMTNRVGHYGGLPSLDLVGNDANQLVIQKSLLLISLFKGKYLEMPRLGFYCVVGKSIVFQEIGMFDEKYIVGGYEDDDYCNRLVNAGYKLALALGSFVYHYQDMSFSGVEFEERKKIARGNQRYYESKWGSYHNLLEFDYFIDLLQKSVRLIGDTLPEEHKLKVELINSIIKKAKVFIPWQYRHISTIDSDGSLAWSHLDVLISELAIIKQEIETLSLALVDLPQRLTQLVRGKSFKITMLVGMFNRSLKGNGRIKSSKLLLYMCKFLLGNKAELRELYRK